jgi:hypothetical protein
VCPVEALGLVFTRQAEEDQDVIGSTSKLHRFSQQRAVVVSSSTDAEAGREPHFYSTRKRRLQLV